MRGVRLHFPTGPWGSVDRQSSSHSEWTEESVLKVLPMGPLRLIFDLGADELSTAPS